MQSPPCWGASNIKEGSRHNVPPSSYREQRQTRKLQGGGFQRSIATMMVGGVHPWHGHHGSTAERKLRSSKEDFGVFGVKLLVRTSYSSQCSSFYLCHWQRYVTFNMWVTRVTTVVTIVQGFFWSQWCQNIVGHNRARISLETIVPSGPRPQPCGGPRVRKGSLTGGRPT